TQAAISGGTTTNYAYDGDGKRMCSSTPCTTPEYVYDVSRGLPVLIQDTSKQYVWGQGLAYSVSGSTIAVHHSDGLGSTRAVTTAAGHVDSSYLTDDFGVSKLIRGTSPARMQYTGEPRDSETGFVYLRARMYDPTVGRFLQRDITFGSRRQSQTLNRYSYAFQNPCLRTDPSGKYPKALREGCTPGEVPEVPDYVDREGTIGKLKEEARAVRFASFSAADPDAYLVSWLVSRFRPGGTWDVKKDWGDEYQDMGNFLYGMAAAMVGINLQLALDGAGIVQQASNWIRHNIKKEETPPTDGHYGDYLRDEECIIQGFTFGLADP
ncbi:MAG: RHS repeat-associated core domain-containing protein, partial [Chloroflexota bacterium]